MERLIKDANEWGAANGKASDLSIESFADVVTAIQQIQEKQQIAGTTAREAAGTLQGSLAMLSGAWENLLAGFANPDLNLDTLINDVVEAAEAAMGNITPVMERALVGIGTLLEKVSPIIGEKLPGILDSVLPDLLSAASTLITTLVENLPTIISSILPSLISAIDIVWDSLVSLGGDLIGKIQEWLSGIDWTQLGATVGDAIQSIDWSGIISSVLEAITAGREALGEAISAFGKGFMSSMGDGMVQNGGELLSKGVEALNNFINAFLGQLTTAITIGVQLIQQILTGIGQALPTVLQSGISVVVNLANGILSNLPSLITAAGNLINSFVEFLFAHGGEIISAGIDLVVQLVNGIISATPDIVVAITTVMVQLIATIVKYAPRLIIEGTALIIKLISGILQAIPQLIQAGQQIGDKLMEKIKSIDWIKAGKDIIDGIIKGVKEAGTKLIEAIVNLCKDSLSAVKKFFGIKSPSRTMRDQVGKFLPAGIAVGIDENADEVTDAMRRLSKSTSMSIKADDMIPSNLISGINANAQGINMMFKNSNEELATRLDALVELTAAYLPVLAKNTESGDFSASDMAKYFNRTLGRAMT